MRNDVWRAEFPSDPRVLNFNHAGLAPVSRRVVRAVTTFLEQATTLGPDTSRGWATRAEVARSAFASLIGSQSDEVAFVKNTSEGISLVASGFDWRVGDNVVLIDGEYPANVYPWWGLRHRGVETRTVERRATRFGVDDLRKAVDRHTRVVAISAVDWQTGFRSPLSAVGAFCRDHDLVLCVDGIQAVGAVAIDVQRDLIDCLAVGGHKWLLAPEGCGCLFVSKRVMDRIRPVLLGWHSVADAERYLPYHFELRPDAQRYEPGSPQHLGVHALGAALDLLLEIGPSVIERALMEVVDALVCGLRERGAAIVSPLGEGERSGILTFAVEGDPAAAVDKLGRCGIICRARAGGVRVAPHFYNDEDDVARFFHALDEM
jgi:cysteine desulfurase/selenocysteine lyase